MRFAKPENQAAKSAANIGKQLNQHFESVGTIRNYQNALKNVALHEIQAGRDIRDLTPELAKSYLEARAEEVSQKTLDMERQAIQAMMQHVTDKLDPNEKLEIVKSQHEQILNSRAYTPEQIKEIATHQTEKNALATEIAHSAGLRAHELLTLERIENRPPDERPTLPEKFTGREGTSYTVTGKGGLIREVIIPNHLAEQLEGRRLEEPQKINDRGVFYQKNYDIGGGKAWSNSFSAASNRALGFSHGAHGVRHAYAQERISELRGIERKDSFLPYERALEVVSQEMGHFRPEITEVYLR